VYAIIATGGKQYRVQEGDQIKVEKLPGDPGEKIEFNQVLLLADGEDVTIGAPYVDGSKVMGEVQDQARAKKIEVIKFKRRKQHMKRMGHRQSFSEIKITGISK
jgi:large subunit ribosomal protein L21